MLASCLQVSRSGLGSIGCGAGVDGCVAFVSIDGCVDGWSLRSIGCDGPGSLSSITGDKLQMFVEKFFVLSAKV